MVRGSYSSLLMIAAEYSERPIFQQLWACVYRRPMQRVTEIGPHPPHREMVRSLARDTTTGPVFYRRQLPPQMLLIDHLFRTSLFPLQHYVQWRGAILEALYRISEGYWFSPSELVMTSLMHFEEKVHRKDLVRVESLPLLMQRLLSQVLEHMGFPTEPRIEMRVRCPLVMSVERGDDHARIFPPPTAGPGGDTGSGGRGLPQRRYICP